MAKLAIESNQSIQLLVGAEATAEPKTELSGGSPGASYSDSMMARVILWMVGHVFAILAVSKQPLAILYEIEAICKKLIIAARK